MIWTISLNLLNLNLCPYTWSILQYFVCGDQKMYTLQLFDNVYCKYLLYSIAGGITHSDFLLNSLPINKRVMFKSPVITVLKSTSPISLIASAACIWFRVLVNRSFHQHIMPFIVFIVSGEDSDWYLSFGFLFPDIIFLSFTFVL